MNKQMHHQLLHLLPILQPTLNHHKSLTIAQVYVTLNESVFPTVMSKVLFMFSQTLNLIKLVFQK